MFKKDYFAPAFITGGKTSSMFVYFNREDTLATIMEPGYFNTSRIVLRPHSFIKIVCQDAIAEITVKSNAGQVVVYEEYILATTHGSQPNQHIDLSLNERKKSKSVDPHANA